MALVAARLGQFLQFLKTQVILIFNFTRPMRLPIQTRNVFWFLHNKNTFLAMQNSQPDFEAGYSARFQPSSPCRWTSTRFGKTLPSPLVSFALLTLVCSAHSPDRFANPRWPYRLHCNNLPLRPRVRCVTIIPRRFVNFRP